MGVARRTQLTNRNGYVANVEALEGRFADSSNFIGFWGPCYTMSSHAALGVVRAGVAVLKGEKDIVPRPKTVGRY